MRTISRRLKFSVAARLRRESANGRLKHSTEFQSRLAGLLIACLCSRAIRCEPRSPPQAAARYRLMPSASYQEALLRLLYAALTKRQGDDMILAD